MKKILVPTDFTQVADNALDHAISLAKVMDASVVALHVVSKKDQSAELKAKVEALAAGKQKDSGCSVEGIIRIGNIFDDIGDTAKEVGAKLIVMGTHGLKGLQFLTGSYALKVVTHSDVPFIIVQDGSDNHDFNHIVMPIDISSETKQKLKFGAEMAKLFDSTVHIVVRHETDEFLQNKVRNNLGFAKDYLNDSGVKFSTHQCEGSNFAKEVISYAKNVNANLITIMNLSADNLIDLFGSSYEQHMITNEPQIPVMLVNRKNIGSFEMNFGMG